MSLSACTCRVSKCVSYDRMRPAASINDVNQIMHVVELGPRTDGSFFCDVVVGVLYRLEDNVPN